MDLELDDDDSDIHSPGDGGGDGKLKYGVSSYATEGRISKAFEKMKDVSDKESSDQGNRMASTNTYQFAGAAFGLKELEKERTGMLNTFADDANLNVKTASPYCDKYIASNYGLVTLPDGGKRRNITLEDVQNAMKGQFLDDAIKTLVADRVRKEMEESDELAPYLIDGEAPFFENAENFVKYVGQFRAGKDINSLYIWLLKSAIFFASDANEVDKMKSELKDATYGNAKFIVDNIIPDAAAARVAGARFFQTVEAVADAIEDSGASVVWDINKEHKLTLTFMPGYGRAISNPVDELNTDKYKPDIVNAASQIPGLDGATIKFLNMSGWAAKYAWTTLVPWLPKGTTFSAEIGGFILIPSGVREYGENKSVTGARNTIKDAFYNRNIGTEDPDLFTIGERAKELKALFEKLKVRRGTNICEKIINHTENYSEGTELLLESEIVALDGLVNEAPFSGGKTSESRIELGTFSNLFSSYYSHDPIKSNISAAYFKFVLEYDEEILENMPATVQFTLWPSLGWLTPFVPGAVPDSELYDGIVGITQRDVAKQVLEKSPQLQDKIPPLTSNVDIGYLINISKDMAAKIGTGGEFNITGASLQGGQVYGEYYFGNTNSKISVNARISAGVSKFLRDSSPIPYYGGSVQAHLNTGFGMLSAAAEYMQNFKYSAGFETYGIRLSYTASIRDLFDKEYEKTQGETYFDEGKPRVRSDFNLRGFRQPLSPKEKFIEYYKKEAEESDKVDRKTILELQPERSTKKKTEESGQTKQSREQTEKPEEGSGTKSEPNVYRGKSREQIEQEQKEKEVEEQKKKQSPVPRRKGKK
ncbi:MAG: hypothetical protein ABIH83_01740 [Candidatus Micrarchaeota archaeon]